MLNNYENLAGTVNSSFQIGGNGFTIRQGIVDPNLAQIPGNDGDMYVLLGVTPTIFQYASTLWQSLSFDQTFLRTKIPTTTFIANNNQFYLGCSLAGTTIQLPQGSSNKRYVIKDESGGAESNPITIIPASPETIDGQASIEINVNYGSLSIIFGDSGWFIY